MAKAKACEYRGEWAVRWRNLRGKQRLKRCPSRRAAESLESKLNFLLSQGIDFDPDAPQPAAADPTKIWDVTLKYLGVGISGRSAKTVRLYTRYLDTFHTFLESRPEEWHTYPGGRAPAVDMLSRGLLEDFLAWLLITPGQQKRERSAVTCGYYVQTVKQMWEWADESERWPDIPRPRRIELPRRTEPDPQAPSWEEWARMLGVLASRPNPRAPEWAVHLGLWVYYTGMRRTESLLLRWEHLDLERKAIAIPAQITKGEYGGREIPLHPALMKRLEGWGTREGWVIKATDRQREQQRAHANRILRHAWAGAGVPRRVWEGQPIHAARHTIESEWAAAGIPQAVIDLHLGHRGQGTGEKHYRARRRLWDRMVEAVATIPTVLLPGEKGYRAPKVKPLPAAQ